jgi:hypothetical protein
MTKREAAIVAAYTGYLLGDFAEMHKYIEEKLERPVFTHELPNLAEVIREKSKQDFINLEVK